MLHRFRAAICLLLAAAAFALPAPGARAAAPVVFQLTAPSAWLRADPDLLAVTTVPIFNANRYEVASRTSDNQWLQLVVGRADARGAWILHSLGEIAQGELAAVPAIPAPPVRAAAGGPQQMPAWIPAMSARMRAVYAAGLRAGRDPNMFTVVGDCNSEPTAYVGRVAAGLYQVPPDHAYLRGVVGQFARSFGRISLAARGGYGTAAMFDPSWSDPFFCHVQDGEGPFPCEMRFSNASIVFIELGTGDQYSWRDFEQHYRPLVAHALGLNAVPVLVTKADDLETHSGAPSGAINAVIRKIAAEFGVPLLDFAAASQDLPNGGLIDEGNADFHLNNAGSDQHLLATLETLYALTRGGGTPAAAAPLAPLPAAPPAVVMPASGRFTIAVDALNVRAAPSLAGEIVSRATRGDALSVAGRSGDNAWLQVDAPGVGKAWVYAALGTLGDAEAGNPAAPPAAGAGAAQFTLNVPAANIRGGPGLDAQVVGSAVQGQRFPLLGRSDDGAWVRIGEDRWVFAALGD